VAIQTTNCGTRIRRVQSELEIAKPYIKVRSGWLLRKLSRLHKKAGKVRDLDVMIGHLTGMRVDGEQDCLIQLQQQLGSSDIAKSDGCAEHCGRIVLRWRKELAKGSRGLEKSDPEQNSWLAKAFADPLSIRFDSWLRLIPQSKKRADP
jgi:hypothetical protein